jgi:hypothetical protein
MNTLLFKSLVRLALLAVLSVTPEVFAQPRPASTNAPVKSPEKITPVEVPKSVFVIPKNKDEGRDPFNPNSGYIYESAAPVKLGTKVVGGRDLVLKVISGTASRRMCTINNSTLVKDEESEVTTPSGKVMVKVIEINDDSVIITVNGEQRELKFRRN